jgi:thiol:disulfide interchange protein
LFNIDLSRYGAGFGPSSKSKGKIVTAFFMGVIAALLAGACVAPVVITVLIYSGQLVSDGNYWGVFLPFLLGIGMALPWPFAGAGLAVIPKPGKWMMRIKQAFGIIIILAAIYYAYVGFSLIRSGGDVNAQFDKLKQALVTSQQEQKPLLIDFWATWCKNCTKMNSTTFKEPDVKDALKNFILVKFQAEDPNDPSTLAAMNYFKVSGLPTFVVVEPVK